MKLEEVLRECARRLGIEEKLGLDSNGVCRFSIGDSLKLSFERSDGEGFFYLYSPLGFLPERKGERGDLLLVMMEGNLFGRLTGEASIGYDGATGLLLLFRRFDESSLSPDDFFLQLQEFLGFQNYWSGVVREALGKAGGGVQRLGGPETGIKRGRDQMIFFI